MFKFPSHLIIYTAFGSTHTLNPVSTDTGFCDQREVDDWGEDPHGTEVHRSTLACLVSAISTTSFT